MANVKITELTEAAQTELADSSVLPIVVNTGEGETPTTKKVTATNLFSLAPQPDLSGYALSSQLEPFATKVSLGSINLNDIANVSAESPPDDNFLQWNGSNWVASEVSVDVATPLTIALRGTDNPHIGANPNQSFKVMDNPSQSAMVIADADGNITYLLKGASAEVKVAKANGTAVRFALASDLPAFVLENDSGEPDIEVTDSSTGEKISVISGDSDTKGANGLPIRQGYNLPDIGANPAPLLISGGTIA